MDDSGLVQDLDTEFHSIPDSATRFGLHSQLIRRIRQARVYDDEKQPKPKPYFINPLESPKPFIREEFEEAEEDGEGGSLGSLISGKAATYLKNKLQKNKQYEGEKHIPLITSKGVQIASFAGPGTNIEKRIAEDSKPLTQADKAAKAHDLRYLLAKGADDIRKADNILINATKKIDNGTLNDPSVPRDNKLNTFAVRNAIRLKKFGENVHLFNADTFTTPGGVKESERKLFENELNKLAMLGYGFLPCERQYCQARMQFHMLHPMQKLAIARQLGYIK